MKRINKFLFAVSIFTIFFVILFYNNFNEKKNRLNDFNASDYNIYQIQKKFSNLFSDSIIILDEWKIYELELCCDFPTSFQVNSFKEIKLNKFEGYEDGEIRFYDPFVFYRKNNKNILYEACFFDIKMKYNCTINLAKFINGNIVENKILHNPEHKVSYPQVVILEGDKVFVSLEEVQSKNGLPGIYELNKNDLTLVNKPIEARLYDTTYFYHKGTFYAFGTDTDGNLRLYYGKNPRVGKFTEHKSSPITSDLNLNRMAGNIIEMNDKLYRFSMKNTEVYGGGINLIEIKTLNENNYEEKFLKEKIFSDTLIDNKTELRHHIVLNDKSNKSGKIKVLIDGANFWPMAMHAKKMKKMKHD